MTSHHAQTAAKRVVIYTRVSRDDTGEGKSNERQEAEARRLCEYKRWDIVEVVADISVSAAGKVKRPGWEKVLGMVERGEVDYVVSYAMDRMTRNMLDLEKLIVLCDAKGIGIATVDGDIDLTSEMGRMIARILAAVARAEIEIKGRRQKLANAERAAAGQPHSGGVRPFGYEDDRLTLIPAEAEAIKAGAARALVGEPLVSLAADWTKQGLVSARGEWTARGVKGVLVNPRYAGIRTYNGERVGTGAWEPVFDIETHLRLVEHLNDPARVKGTVKLGRTPASLLTGIATCSVCGVAVRGSSVRGRLTYACRNSHAHIERTETDELVIEAAAEILSQPSWSASLVPSGDDRLDKAKRVVEEKREALKMYARLLATGAMDEEQFTEATAVAKAATKEAERIVSLALTGSVMEGLDLGTDRVLKQLHAMPLHRQRGVVQALLRVEIRPQTKARSRMLSVPDRVTATPA